MNGIVSLKKKRFEITLQCYIVKYVEDIYLNQVAIGEKCRYLRSVQPTLSFLTRQYIL